MAHSYAQQPTLSCYVCGQPFVPVIWLIIDRDERPDLLARVREGTIHTIACPNDHKATIDAPLLLFDPGQTGPLFFSPPEGTTAEQDQQIATELLSRLAKSMGSGWRSEWLEGLTPIPRALLPVMLEGLDPQATIAALEEIASALAEEDVELDSEEDMERLLDEHPRLREKLIAAMRIAVTSQAREADAPESGFDDRVLLALRDFVQTDTWFESYQQVAEHPELLTDTADKHLSAMIGMATAAGNEEAAQHFSVHLALLRRSRAVGATAAFAEIMETTPERLKAASRVRAAVDTIPSEARQAAAEVVTALRSEGLRIDSLDELEAALKARPELEARLAAAATLAKEIPLNIQGDVDARAARAAETLKLLTVIRGYVETANWFEAYHYLNDHPELLSPEVDVILGQLLQRALDDKHDNAVREFSEYRQLLDRSREVGVALAISEKVEMPVELLDGMAQLLPSILPPAQQFFEELKASLAVEGISIDSPDKFWAILAERPELEARFRAIIGVGQTPRKTAPDIPEVFQTSWEEVRKAQERYLQSKNPSALDEEIGAWEHILKREGFQDAPQAFQVAVLNDAANAFWKRHETGIWPQDLDRALSLWGDAASLLPAQSKERAPILSNLSVGLRDRYIQIGQLQDLELTIAMSGQALDLLPSDSTERASYLNNLGIGLSDRYALMGEKSNLDEAIVAWQEAVSSTPGEPPYKAIYLNNLGTGLYDRYKLTADPRDLDTAISNWKKAISLAPDERESRLNNLGNGLLARHEYTGQAEDLDAAIDAYTEAISLLPVGHLDRPSRLSNFGSGLIARYELHGQQQDIDAAIAAWQEAAELTAEDNVLWPQYVGNVGNGLLHRYKRRGHPGDLDAAIEAWQRAIKRARPDSPGLSIYLTNLSNGLDERYNLTGVITDLDAAIHASEQALILTPLDALDRTITLANLGVELLTRYRRLGQIQDLNRAVAILQEAIDKTPVDSLARATRLSNLGGGLLEQYKHFSRVEDLDGAITVWQEAVNRTLPESPDLSTYLDNLGNGLHSRYQRTGDPADLASAIEANQRAVDLAPSDSPARSGYLINLGSCLGDSYQLTGQIETLEKAIEVSEFAVKLAPIDAPRRPGYLNTLALSLSYRFERFGQLQDLDRAIEAYQDAVNSSLPAAPEHALYLNNLGGGLLKRYRRTGRLEDLDVTIATVGHAVSLTPETSHNRSLYLSSLAVLRMERYRRSGQLSDLDSAIEVWRAGILNTSEESPFRIGLVNNLGLALSTRYGRTGDFAYQESAIIAFRMVCNIVPPGSPDETMYLGNLAAALSDNYRALGILSDLDEAISIYEKTYKLTSNDPHARALHLNNYSSALSTRYMQTRQQVDLDNAARLAQEASQASVELAGEVSLASSLNWAKSSLQREAWDQTLQAAEMAHSILRRLDEANILSGERLSWRREIQGLAATEAYAYTRLGDLRSAVLALEAGQAGQLNAALGRGRDRALLKQLRDEASPLFATYEAAAEEVRVAQQIGSAEDVLHGINSYPLGGTEVRRRATAAQTTLDSIVERIRLRKGYEEFFAPLTFDDVTAALTTTPLAYLATTRVGSVILLLQRVTGEIISEAFWTDLTTYKLDRLLIRRAVAEGNAGMVIGGLLPAQMTGLGLKQELDTVLPVLGERLMAPLAARLRELKATAVMLIPGGQLNLLPLHGASYEIDGTRRAFLDEFAVTFAPSAQTIVESRTRAADEPGPATALVVGNPMPAQLPLRFAHEEAEEVAALLGAHEAFAGRVKTLHATDATLLAVGTALPGTRTFHFACHGMFDADEPLDSGLIMAHEEILTLRAIRDSAALNSARLVVLSACQTGLTDFRELPDEVIGLPAGFLAAGAAGVVGSLWPVDDRSTALLMTNFHRRMLAGASPAEALRAAQLWLRSVTWGELDAYYTKFLPRMSAESAEDAQVEATQHDPNEAAYSEPYYWAAFAFSGI